MVLRAIVVGFVVLAALVPLASATTVVDTLTGLVKEKAPVAAPVADLVQQTGDTALATPPPTRAIVQQLPEVQAPPPTIFVGWDESSSSSAGGSTAHEGGRSFGLLGLDAPFVPIPVTGIVGGVPLISTDTLGLPLFAPLAPAASTTTTAPLAPPAPVESESQPSTPVELARVTPLAIGVATVAAVGAAAPALASPLAERLRKFGFVAFLYTRIAKERLLDHAGREKLLAELSAAPGLSVVDLAARAGTPRNTATYHLRRLEKEGLVLSEPRGRVRLWFPAGASVGRAQAPAIAALRHDTTRAVAQGIGAAPGIDQRTLCAQLNLPPSLAHWHADRLVSAGLVRKERDGRRVRYYPGESFGLVARSA